MFWLRHTLLESKDRKKETEKFDDVPVEELVVVEPRGGADDENDYDEDESE